MRKLAGGIPRAWKNHKSVEGAAYRAYCRAKLEGFKVRGLSLPKDAMATLREAGKINVRLRFFYENQPKRLTRLQRQRLDRQEGKLQERLPRYEDRLEQMAKSNGQGHDLAARMAQLHEARRG